MRLAEEDRHFRNVRSFEFSWDGSRETWCVTTYDNTSSVLDNYYFTTRASALSFMRSVVEEMI